MNYRAKVFFVEGLPKQYVFEAPSLKKRKQRGFFGKAIFFWEFFSGPLEISKEFFDHPKLSLAEGDFPEWFLPLWKNLKKRAAMRKCSYAVVTPPSRGMIRNAVALYGMDGRPLSPSSGKREENLDPFIKDTVRFLHWWANRRFYRSRCPDCWTLHETVPADKRCSSVSCPSNAWWDSFKYLQSRIRE